MKHNPRIRRYQVYKEPLSLHDKVGAVQLVTANAAEQLYKLHQNINDMSQREIAHKACKLASDSLKYLLKDLKSAQQKNGVKI